MDSRPIRSRESDVVPRAVGALPLQKGAPETHMDPSDSPACKRAEGSAAVLIGNCFDAGSETTIESCKVALKSHIDALRQQGAETSLRHLLGSLHKDRQEAYDRENPPWGWHPRTWNFKRFFAHFGVVSEETKNIEEGYVKLHNLINGVVSEPYHVKTDTPGVIGQREQSSVPGLISFSSAELADVRRRVSGLLGDQFSAASGDQDAAAYFMSVPAAALAEAVASEVSSAGGRGGAIYQDGDRSADGRREYRGGAWIPIAETYDDEEEPLLAHRGAAVAAGPASGGAHGVGGADGGKEEAELTGTSKELIERSRAMAGTVQATLRRAQEHERTVDTERRRNPIAAMLWGMGEDEINRHERLGQQSRRAYGRLLKQMNDLEEAGNAAQIREATAMSAAVDDVGLETEFGAPVAVGDLTDHKLQALKAVGGLDDREVVDVRGEGNCWMRCALSTSLGALAHNGKSRGEALAGLDTLGKSIADGKAALVAQVRGYANLERPGSEGQQRMMEWMSVIEGVDAATLGASVRNFIGSVAGKSDAEIQAAIQGLQTTAVAEGKKINDVYLFFRLARAAQYKAAGRTGFETEEEFAQNVKNLLMPSNEGMASDITAIANMLHAPVPVFSVFPAAVHYADGAGDTNISGNPRAVLSVGAHFMILQPRPAAGGAG